MSINQFRMPGTGEWHLAIVAHRRFVWDSSGRLSPAEDQQPPIGEESSAWKPATDVVVHGHIYAPDGRSTEMVAELDIGPIRSKVRATGPRRVVECSGESCSWTPPEPFDRVALAAELAYGGFDSIAYQREGDAIAEAASDLGATLERVSHFAYPRNRVGVGFYQRANGAANVGRPIPALDDPDDPVVPERLLRDGPLDWIDAPCPAFWGWADPEEFPRASLLGFDMQFSVPQNPIREVELGVISPSDLSRTAPEGFEGLPYGLLSEPRSLSAARPGMAAHRLRGDEELRMLGLEHDVRERAIRLPGRAPAVRCRPPGCSWFELQPQLDTLVLSPDQRSLLLVFTANLRIAGRYPPGELCQVEESITW